MKADGGCKDAQNLSCYEYNAEALHVLYSGCRPAGRLTCRVEGGGDQDVHVRDVLLKLCRPTSYSVRSLNKTDASRQAE